MTAAEQTAGRVATDHLGVFGSDAYNRLNVAPDRIRRLDHVDDGRLVGSLVGVVEDDELCSGHSAPFGGPDFVREAETPTSVAAAWDDWIARIEEEGIAAIRVRLPPEAYSPSTAASRFAMLNRGFVVERCELNLHVDLAGMRDADDYLATLRSPARRALKHLRGRPFALREATSPADWSEGYEVLRRNREAKGRALRLSEAYVRTARESLAGRVRMLVLDHAGVACAAALLYRVRPRYELVVYWGDAHDLDRSPMNLLALHVMERAIAEDVEIVDLGISSVDGRADAGLVQFKRSVGAREGLRLDLLRRP